MDPIAIILMLVIGAVAGWLAGVIYSGEGFGLIGNIVVGILGAIIAGALLPGFLHFSGIIGQIISDAIGAIILLFLVNFVYRMDIRIESLLEGAARASGAVAIIDVLRAFTTAAVAFANGAARITMVASVEEALVLRAQGAGQICMGEVGGRPPKSFDFGNSPYELSKVDLAGVDIIQRTSAGTQGVVAAAKQAQSMPSRLECGRRRL